MRLLYRLVRTLRNSPSSRRSQPRFHVAIEALEDRCTPSSGTTSIAFNFNNTPITAGSTIWFSSGLQASGLGNGPVTVNITNQSIAFTASGTNYSITVPNSAVTFTPGTTAATTTYSASTNTWTTAVPSNLGGSDFLGGVAFTVPSGLPGGITNVTWRGQMQSTTPNVQVQWHAEAAVYRQFNTDYTQLGVKPCDDGHASTYQNPDHAGTPEAFKSYVIGGAGGPGGNNYTGQPSPNAQLTPPVPPPPGVTYISGTSSDYPFTSSNPLTSVAFNESDVLTGAAINVNNNTFELWYTDEHAMTLGVNQVTVIAANGTATTTKYPVTALNGVPGSAINPAVGTTTTTGDQAGTDPAGRLLAPSLYITDITNDPTSRSGDWQYGGTAIPPSAVFGTWKSYAKTVNYAQGGLVTLTGANDPAKNGWNLGPGADAPPPGLPTEGYTTEVRWDLNALIQQGVLIPGHNYRFYVMVHDGDQNKTGGDVGQASYQVNLPAPVNTQPATISGTVFDDSGVMPTGLAGIQIVLSGFDANGNPVNRTAITDVNGNYSFSNVAPGGNYTLTEASFAPNYIADFASAGTVNSHTDGVVAVSEDSIGAISLNGGDAGINFDFYQKPMLIIG
jgi:hypothetical protein